MELLLTFILTVMSLLQLPLSKYVYLKFSICYSNTLLEAEKRES